MLVADLDAVAPREGPALDALLRSADAIVAGTVPRVSYNGGLEGDPVRYLFDEGVALRRVAGILAHAYAVTGDVGYLDVMARDVALNAARWPDWNPGHPLDTAGVTAAVALALAWSGDRLEPVEQRVVVDALVGRVLSAYSCVDGSLAAALDYTGNRATVVATAVALAGLAVRADEPAWAAAAVAEATTVLRRRATADAGRSVATGPTVEGLMYTTYESANIALLHATVRAVPSDLGSTVLASALPDLDDLARWTERCGTVPEVDIEDAWDRYPWVDRPTALAGLAAWPAAGARVRSLLDELQRTDVLTVPRGGTWVVPDGIAELVLAGQPQPQSPVPMTSVRHATVDGRPGSHWGCLAEGELRAVVGAAPNDASHAHRDVGTLVVRDGDDEVLADLGQRDYGLRGVDHVWRAATPAHSTVGLLRDDGRVTQRQDGSGTVATTTTGLVVDTASALAGTDWRREVTATSDGVTIVDRLRLRRGEEPVTVSTAYLLAVPPGRVADLGGGRLRVRLESGARWELRLPAGTTPSIRDASPVPPYEDSADVSSSLGPAHTLVTVTAPLKSTLDLTTALRRLPAR